MKERNGVAAAQRRLISRRMKGIASESSRWRARRSLQWRSAVARVAPGRMAARYCQRRGLGALKISGSGSVMGETRKRKEMSSSEKRHQARRHELAHL